MITPSLINDLFNSRFTDPSFRLSSNSNFAYDANDTQLEIAYSVLGFGNDEVSVEAIDNKLKIKATKSEDETISNKLVQNIDDVFAINKDYDVEKSDCSIKNGVLLITIPKKAELAAKKLSIKLLN